MFEKAVNDMKQWTLSSQARNEQIQDRLRKDFYKSFSHLAGKDADELISPDRLMRNAPHDAWLNGAQKVLAERRIIDAQILQAPYVTAIKKIGANLFAFDATMSNSAVAFGGNIRSKMFNPDGVEWVHSPTDMQFFTYFFEVDEWVNLGSYESLVKKGYERVTLNRLLAFNHVLESGLGEKRSSFTPAENLIVETKLTYWAFILRQKIGRNSEALAASVIKNIDPSEFEQALLEQTAYSATSDQLLLQTVVERNIDVDKKCIKLGCMPITWAALKGARDAVEQLLPRAPNASGDLPFIKSYGGYVEDIDLVNWYIALLESPES